MRSQTVSEQSVLVRGYGAVVVSNDYRNRGLLPDSTGDDALDNITNAIALTLSGFPLHQLFGVHKFLWNPDTQLFYCIGSRWGAWTLEALD